MVSGSRRLLILSVICAAIGGCSRSKNSDPAAMEPIPTPLWAGTYYELNIKTAMDGSGDLLLMVRTGNSVGAIKDPIYRYSRTQAKLMPIALETWEDNRSLLTLCSTQRKLMHIGDFPFHLVAEKLQFRGAPVETAAQTVLAAYVDPSEEFTSVLSAEGKVEKGWMPFSDPVVSGKRFHQVFGISDGKEVGKPVILRGTTNRDDIRPCWSPDSKYVVYFGGWCERLWIVKVDRVKSEGDK